jgi:hypothetical protein
VRPRRLAFTAALAALAALAPLGLAAADSSPQVTVFARISSPGYPANALVASNGTVYAGTFHSLAANSPSGPSKVFAFSPAGKLERTYTIIGQTPGGDDDGVQVAATDHSGTLYLLDQSPARVLKLNPVTGAQTTWATFSVLPQCTGKPNGACTDGAGGSAAEPDFAAWGPDGSMYVTDYNQSVIWRIPPGGGKATVWMTDHALYGIIVGPAGLVTMPGGHELMFDTGGDAYAGGTAAQGRLYTIPIEPNGTAGPMTQIWQSGDAEAPDGLALARSGHIYVALVGPSGNAIDELSATGTLIQRIPGNAAANQQQTIPFDAPGSVSFDGDSIIVGNQSSIVENTADMALLEVNVGEPGMPIALPPAPRQAKHKSKPKRKHHKHKRSPKHSRVHRRARVHR